VYVVRKVEGIVLLEMVETKIKDSGMGGEDAWRRADEMARLRGP
jgi:hypothetical protein